MAEMIKNDLLNSIENPDNQLVVDAQNGSVEAEETLIRKYTGLVMKKTKAYYMAGADENDVIQEGMIGLLKAVRKYDSSKKASFATFAEICVTSQIINAIRSADRVKHKPLNTSVSLSGPVNDSLDNGSDVVTLGDTISSDRTDRPEDLLIIKDVTYYILHNGDNIFSKFEMEVLNEYMKGYSYDQIGRKLGKTPKSIDNAIQRCKKKVNEYLWK